MTIPIPNPHIAISMLAFFQGTQLNLFERFLTQAVAGIDSTSITSGMQNVAYVVLLVGFLWQVYQSALHGGDVRGLPSPFPRQLRKPRLSLTAGQLRPVRSHNPSADSSRPGFQNPAHNSFHPSKASSFGKDHYARIPVDCISVRRSRTHV